MDNHARRGPARALLFVITLFMLLAPPVAGARAGNPLSYRPIDGASPVPRADRPIEAEELEVFLDGVIAGQFATHRLAGAALVVVKDGQVVLRKGYGYADLDKRVPVDPGVTGFTVGSISKLLVWTAVMQLVEQGKLDLDADVNRYLTRFQIDDSFDAPITLRHLMTHTAGLEEVGTPFAPEIAGRYASLGDFLASNLPKRAMPPAANFAHAAMPYSNWGPLLAAHVVETVSGERFDRYAARHILDPLGMASSRFQTDATAAGPNRALGYAYEDGAMAGRLEDMTASGPAGALIATADDIARLMIAHLERGKAAGGRILAPETVALMHRRSAQSSSHLDAVALGFMESHQNGRRLLRHDGSTRFNHSDLVLLPDRRVGLFVTYNSHDGGYARREIIKAFLDRYYPAEIPLLRAPPAARGDLASYVGDYRSLRRSFTTNEALFGAFPLSVRALPNGRLLVAGSQWQKVAPDTFRNADGEFLGFNRGSGGGVASLSLKTSLVPAERIAWYQNPLVHAPVAALAILSGLLAIVMGLMKRTGPTLPHPACWAGRLATAVGALNILSCVAFASAFAGGLAAIMDDGPPPGLYVGTVLSLWSLGLTGALAVAVAHLVRNRYFSRRRRLAYVCGWLVAVLYLVILAYWNLLGFHIG